MTTPRINLLPAIQQLCTIEASCPPNEASGAQGIRGRDFVPQPRYRTHLTPSQDLASSSLYASDYETVIAKIETILESDSLPKEYRDSLVHPFYVELTKRGGKDWFQSQLLNGRGEKLIENVVHAILQNFSTPPEGAIPRENTEAVREITSDLYQTFLARECRIGGAPTCKSIPSPVPNWCKADLSTYPDISRILETEISIVNVPARYATQGAIAWGCFGHEDGHDIFGAYPHALEELKGAVQDAMKKAGFGGIGSYWDRWVNEAASDVLGVLHLGPAGALSMIGFLKALGKNANFNLATIGYLGDEHPVDLIRGFLVEAAVNFLKFSDRFTYMEEIHKEIEKEIVGCEYVHVDVFSSNLPEEAETFIRQYARSKNLSLQQRDKIIDLILSSDQRDRFVQFFRPFVSKRGKRPARLEDVPDNEDLHGKKFTVKECRESARLFAAIVMREPLQALGGKSFGDIRSWANTDEKICKKYRDFLSSRLEKVKIDMGETASHVVSAAILESIYERGRDGINPQRLQTVFQRMINVLKIMNQNNPKWIGTPLEQSDASSSEEEEPPRSRLSPPASNRGRRAAGW